MKPPTPKTPQNSSSTTPTGSSYGTPHHPYPPQSHSAYGESPIPLPPGKSHMDALRAHAHSASGHSGDTNVDNFIPHQPTTQINEQKLTNLPGHHNPTEPVHVDIEPEPEPDIPSPTHNIQRGPSPEAKPDDTECHRSQSAM